VNPEAIAKLEDLIGSIKPKGRGLRVASNRCE
jgi:hypothetical protein